MKFSVSMYLLFLSFSASAQVDPMKSLYYEVVDQCSDLQYPTATFYAQVFNEFRFQGIHIGKVGMYYSEKPTLYLLPNGDYRFQFGCWDRGDGTTHAQTWCGLYYVIGRWTRSGDTLTLSSLGTATIVRQGSQSTLQLQVDAAAGVLDHSFPIQASLIGSKKMVPASVSGQGSTQYCWGRRP